MTIKRTKGQASPKQNSNNEVLQPNETITVTKTNGKEKQNQSPKPVSPPQKRSRKGKEVEPKRWSKYQSYDAQEDQDERRRMLADIQINELEANYQFDS